MSGYSLAIFEITSPPDFGSQKKCHKTEKWVYLMRNNGKVNFSPCVQSEFISRQELPHELMRKYVSLSDGYDILFLDDTDPKLYTNQKGSITYCNLCKLTKDWNMMEVYDCFECEVTFYFNNLFLLLIYLEIDFFSSN